MANERERVIRAAMDWYRMGVERRWKETDFTRGHPMRRLWTGCAALAKSERKRRTP